MFYLWWRMDEENRARVWRLYGWFTALMSFGSCAGTVAWAARMMSFENFFKANDKQDKFQKASFSALAYRWSDVFFVAYAIEFMCLSTAKLMVLDRMSAFAAPQGTRLQKR